MKVGERRGHFVVMSVSNEKSNGRKSWNLLCDCGKIVMKPTGLCVREVICGEGRF